ncbi:MAG: hypothetical protein AAF399_10010 [Bacteroidota bacterium]
MEKDPFYIGWQAQGSEAFRAPVKRLVILAILLCLLLPLAIVSWQRGFATSTFELGQLTEVRGILEMEPVPMLRVSVPGESGTPIYQRILLIGFGKHGAEPTLQQIEATKGEGFRLAGKDVTLRGTLIYHDGRTLLELTEKEEALVAVAEGMAATPTPHGTLRQISLQGEITDPKCKFGVMKPGFDKPHRSCASLCIAGGIPPVFVVETQSGQSQQFLLLGKAGTPINQAVLPYIGERLQLCGHAYQLDDWQVLEVDPAQQIKRLGPSGMADASWCQ